VVVSWENGNEISGFIKYWEFITAEQLSAFQGGHYLVDSLTV
jgi:hypothetical protein